MGFFGNLGGRILGSGVDHVLGGNGQVGNSIGGALGNFLPFKKGGRVPGKKGQPRKAIVHGGEYVLPASVKPTMAQKKKVAELKKRGKK
jgi:hypothetical protein